MLLPWPSPHRRQKYCYDSDKNAVLKRGKSDGFKIESNSRNEAADEYDGYDKHKKTIAKKPPTIRIRTGLLSFIFLSL